MQKIWFLSILIACHLNQMLSIFFCACEIGHRAYDDIWERNCLCYFLFLNCNLGEMWYFGHYY